MTARQWCWFRGSGGVCGGQQVRVRGQGAVLATSAVQEQRRGEFAVPADRCRQVVYG
jgi:hypothetical protein